MSKFDEYFSEPQYFSHGAYVMSRKLSREDAAKQLEEALGEPIDPEELEFERVRYGFAPEDIEDRPSEACWYTGAYGKGSIPVWVYG